MNVIEGKKIFDEDMLTPEELGEFCALGAIRAFHNNKLLTNMHEIEQMASGYNIDLRRRAMERFIFDFEEYKKEKGLRGIAATNAYKADLSEMTFCLSEVMSKARKK